MIAALTGCFPTPSKQFACETTPQCESGRVCTEGYCVIASVDAGTPAPDSSVVATPDAGVDAAPVTQTFAVGAECNTSRCGGGYGGQKNASGPPTADKICTTHMFPRALSYTISSQQPGGRFCSYDATTMAFACDPSCSGCNAIDSVTCSNP